MKPQTLIHMGAFVFFEPSITSGAYACRYLAGDLPPHHPLPVVEVDNALAMPHKYATFWIKAALLKAIAVKE